MDSRRRAIMGIKKGRLPSEYQEVEYLESTGEQYIDSGIKANQNSYINLDYTLTETEFATYFFGTQTSSNVRAFLGGRNSPSDGYSMFGQFDTVPYTTVQMIRNQDYTNKHNFVLDKNGSYCDGVLSRIFIDYKDFTSDDNILIFNTINSGSIVKKGGFKLHNCTYRDGATSRNFIPCYRKADNKPGIYDLAGSICPLTNSPLYINANTRASTDFIVGPNV